jgi:hypothetical protein
VALALDKVWPELGATYFLRETLERYLDGQPAYGTGRVYGADWLTEDGMIQCGTAPLLALAEYLRHSGDDAFWNQRRLQCLRKLHEMKARDADGDGLVEARGRDGQNRSASSNWFDQISFGWKDAFANAQLYQALVIWCKVADRRADREIAALVEPWARRLRDTYTPTFLSPATGWYAGWQDKAGNLHDYGFLFVNGLAVAAGLADDGLTRHIPRALWNALRAVGFEDFRLGLPTSLYPIPPEDCIGDFFCAPFQNYQNGAATTAQACWFIEALYRAGMQAEGDRVLGEVLLGLAERAASAGCQSGREFAFWDGTPVGYEGLLTDQFEILATAVRRFGV